MNIRTEPARKLTKLISGNSLIISFDTPLVPQENVEVIREQSGSTKARELVLPIHEGFLTWIRSKASPPIPVLDTGKPQEAPPAPMT